MKIKFLIKVITLFTFVFTATFGAGYAVVNWWNGDPFATEIVVNDKGETVETEGRINVLLMGIDARPGEKNTRTDSLIVASIDRSAKKVALLSVPRDTLVEIPGHGKTKINSANEIGGSDLAVEMVEKVLDTKIDFWVKTNFDGFKDIVDTLGGVNLDVEKRMGPYSDPTDGTYINLKPGKQRLDGKLSLDYVRFRHDALGDISRTQRQQKFLKALAKEIMQPSTILKLPKLVPDLMAAVETNLSTRQMVALAKFAGTMDQNMDIAAQTLPGQFYNNRGSYWKYDEAKAKVVLNDLIQGVTSDTIAGPDINVANNRKKTKTNVASNTKKPKQTIPAPVDDKKSENKESQNQPSTDTNGTPGGEGNNTTPGTDVNNGGNNQPGNNQPGTGTQPGTKPGTGTQQPGTGAGGTTPPTTPPPTIPPTTTPSNPQNPPAQPPATNPNPVVDPGVNANTTSEVVAGTM